VGTSSQLRELFPAAVVAVEQDRHIDLDRDDTGNINDEVSAGFVGGIAPDDPRPWMNDDACDASSMTMSGEAK
jgi:hypothetical protein